MTHRTIRPVPTSHLPRPGRDAPIRRILHPARLALVVLVAVTFGSVALAAPAGAGGWAIASIDSIPDASAGSQEVVGFTILQHGVTPADLLGDPEQEVGVELVGPDGEVVFFPAVAGDAPGHYRATVAFGSAGDHVWRIRMGWFGTQELGVLAVAANAPSTGASWPTVRSVLLALGATFAVVAAADVLAGRRRARLAPS